MSTDDESKQDEQNTEGSAHKQDAEQASPVYLFPENSVYDLAPIVIPDNIRLGAPAGDEAEADDRDYGQAADQAAATTEDADEKSVSTQALIPESSNVNITASEVSSQKINPDDRGSGSQSTESAFSRPVSLPQQPPIGSTLGKLKIQARKVKATADLSKVVSRSTELDPVEPTEQTAELHQASSTAETAGEISITAESPAADVLETSQQARLNDSETTAPGLKPNDGQPTQTGETSPTSGSSSDAVNVSASETAARSDHNEEWSEHASAVLEHFGWEQAGWSPPQEHLDIQASSDKSADDNVEVQIGNATEPADEIQVEQTHDEISQPAEQSSEAANDEDYGKNFFPEHSAFDLEPIVIPDDQRLGSPAGPQAEVSQPPQTDPRKTAPHQKLSPIKIGQLRPAARKETPNSPKPVPKHDSQISPAAQYGVPHAEQNGESGVSLVQPNITIPTSNGDEHIVISESEPADPNSNGSADGNVGAESIVIESDAEGAIEQGTHVPAPGDTAAVDASPFGASSLDASSVASMEGTVEPGVTFAEPNYAQSDLDGRIDESQTSGNWDEQTGWEDVVSQQERWQEKTGWEEAVEEKGEWERSGWSDSDTDAGVDPQSTSQETSLPDPQVHSQEISPPDPQVHSQEIPQLDPQVHSQEIALPDRQAHSQEIGQRDPLPDNQIDTASSAHFESSGGDSVTGTVQTGDLEPVKRAPSVDALFGGADDDDIDDVVASESSGGVEDLASVGIKTLEIEPTEREFIEEQIGTATGDSNYPFEPEDETTNNQEFAGRPESGTYPAIVISESSDQAPEVVSSQTVEGNDQPVTIDNPVLNLDDSAEIPPMGSFDINNLGIGTADIDQIILEHSSVQLTLRAGALEEAEEEERYLRELLLTEQRDAELQDQKYGVSPVQSQEHTNPDLQDNPQASSSQELEVAALKEEPTYDEEDSLQEFRPTDSIYELAPFVLPAAGERLTDKDSPGSGTKKPAVKRTMEQAINAADTPERAAVPSYSSDPLVGTTLAHSYEVLDVIGQGGMAIVYRAKQIATGRLVAIKTLKSQNPPDVMRFSQEIKTHAQLAHKNVVDYIDSFSARGQLFLVMERIRGISLEEIIRTFGKLDEPANIVDILTQILDALEYAHSGGLIHRDLKTGNVILIKEQDEAMVVKILDFGIAKIQGDLQRLTHVGQALGSPIYMSPEQCSGKLLTTKSDLYSLGVVAYETVTGTPPYSKGTLINVMAAHCNENIKPKPLSETAPHLPKFKLLDQILQKALQTPAEKRWQSAEEFRVALQFWLRSVEIDAVYDELPVELMRSPVTELDIDKLVASASANTAPSKPNAAPAFSWAQEPAAEPQAISGQALSPVSAPDQKTSTGENAGWDAEDQEVDDIWPEQQGGWEEGTKPVEVVPGWGDASGAWGRSEKHRQSDSPENEATEDISTASPPADPTPTTTSGANQSIPDPNQKLFQSNYQAETSDLWNAQQNQVNQRRSSVRDLLASPFSIKEEPKSFEVQTSVEMNAVGSEPPNLQQPAQPAELPPPAPIPNISFDPNPITASSAAESMDQMDLRKRQAPEQPRSATNNIVLYIIIGVVMGIAITFLFVYYFFVQTDTFNIRKGAKTNQTAPASTIGPVRNTPIEPDASTTSTTSTTEPTKTTDEVSPESEKSEATDSPVQRRGRKKSDSTEPDTAPEASTSRESTDSKSDETPAATPTSEDATSSDATRKPSSTEPSSTTNPSNAPTPFKKGEPEEGVDF
ncbi:MAG: protein kinase [Candidatus Melainabacteria bacterium]|nr:protein kinase [Candidatus Melainabacteria bacterium]